MEILAPVAPAVNQPARAVSVAFLLGASDGDAGSLCLPELFFVKRESILNYVKGHEAAVGETMLSRQAKKLYKVQA